jgi:hypothetical protein
MAARRGVAKVAPGASTPGSVDRSHVQELQDSSWQAMSEAAISTVTIYKEASDHRTFNLDVLFDKVAAIVRLNPWLTGRLKMSQQGVRSMYAKDPVNCFYAISKPNTVDLENVAHKQLMELLLPHCVKCGEMCIDRDEPLFKVTAIVHGESPNKQLFLVVSLSSLIADVPTFYNIYGMLDEISQPYSLSIEPVPIFDTIKTEILGKPQRRWLNSSVMSWGQWWQSTFEEQCKMAVYVVNKSWIEKEKEEYNTKADAQVLVTTNDVITSWFMRTSKCDFGFMYVDFRKYLDVTTAVAGKYVHPLLYRPNDFQTPYTVKHNLPIMTRLGQFRPTIPGLRMTFDQNSCLVSNYASVTTNVAVTSGTQILHLPLLFRDYGKSHDQYYRPKTSDYFRNEMVIFKPTPDSTGVIVFDRQLKLGTYLASGVFEMQLFKVKTKKKQSIVTVDPNLPDLDDIPI